MTYTKDKFFELINSERDVFAKSYSVRRLGLFGSCVRGEDSAESDIDVLVEFDVKNFDNYMGLKFFLEERLNRKVDLVILDALKPALKDEILREVKYAA